MPCSLLSGLARSGKNARLSATALESDVLGRCKQVRRCSDTSLCPHGAGLSNPSPVAPITSSLVRWPPPTAKSKPCWRFLPKGSQVSVNHARLLLAETILTLLWTCHSSTSTVCQLKSDRMLICFFLSSGLLLTNCLLVLLLYVLFSWQHDGPMIVVYCWHWHCC